jgi:hypothetical protein
MSEFKQLKKLKQRYERNCCICKDMSKPESVRKNAARYASYLAERLQFIKRPKGCQWCKQRRYLYRHHWNYAEPLNIEFLCKECHLIADQIFDFTNE